MEENFDAADTLELGSKIKISGFRDLDGGKMVVVKKIVGNYVKKIEERHASFREIYIHMKMIHNNQFEIQIKTTMEGDVKHFEVTDYNLFFALDNALNRALQHSW